MVGVSGPCYYSRGGVLNVLQACSDSQPTCRQLAVIAQNVLHWPVRKHEDALNTRQLRYQLHSVKGRAKCPTDAASVPQRLELVTGRLHVLDSAPDFVQ